MRIFPALALAVCGLAALSACRATNSVELFRVNDNGEVVNIGRGSDYEHLIYGHFRTATAYDRAFVTVQPSESGADSVCYVKVNDGQVNNGVGVGIRLAPCSNAKLVNELTVANGLDGIGIYDLTKAPWGTYFLYFYDGSAFRPILETPFFDEHLAAGLDAFRINPENPAQAFITYSYKDENGHIGVAKKTVETQTLLSGDVYRIAVSNSGVAGSFPSAETIDNSAQSAGNAESLDNNAQTEGNSTSEHGFADNSDNAETSDAGAQGAENPASAHGNAENAGIAPAAAAEEAIDDTQAVTPNGDPIPPQSLHRADH